MSRDETFLGRWSRRKQEKPETVIAEDHALAQARTFGESIAPSPPGGDEAMPASAATIPTPADLPAVDSLTREADFSRFMRPDVPPQMKTAALKKLFTDPHFNIMDGLDTYIDDYTRADPIPESMLRKLAQSKMLGLFDSEKDCGPGPATPPEGTPAAPDPSSPTSVWPPDLGHETCDGVVGELPIAIEPARPR